LLRLADLAGRDDFEMGPLRVSPSRRTLEGPFGTAHVEPRIMQVLLLLADSEGSVVTRSQLFEEIWSGAAVGDDSLNRAIGRVRQATAEVAPGAIEIETIPRTGYRLLRREAKEDAAQTRHATASSRVSRRTMVGGALALGLGGVAAWLALGNRDHPEAATMVAKGRQAVLYGSTGAERSVAYFRRAVTLAPEDAAAWGWLAVGYRNIAENAEPDKAAAAVQQCEQAARRALALDPREANALAALATVQPFFGDWYAAERRIIRVLDAAPDNFTALNEITLLTQAAGYDRESWSWNEKAASVAPLSPLPQYKKALKHWIMGDVPKADLAIDRALHLWPRHPAVWNSRMMLFAFTGRPEAAAAFLDDVRGRPATFTDATLAFWKPSLDALGAPTPAKVARARAVNRRFAPRSPGFSVLAIMVTSSLGDLDSAFEIASGFYLRHGQLVGTLWTGSGQMPVDDMRWRRTMNLFTPATKGMREDPRFAELCHGIGLTDFWRRRGIAPDYQRAPR
jgi:DNA-binding winged helix-turn-helix (wHTH) protein/Flp pilus assembly protein TadD